VTPDSDYFWIAHIEPYTESHFNTFMDEIRGSAHLKDESSESPSKAAICIS